MQLWELKNYLEQKDLIVGFDAYYNTEKDDWCLCVHVMTSKFGIDYDSKKQFSKKVLFTTQRGKTRYFQNFNTLFQLCWDAWKEAGRDICADSHFNVTCKTEFQATHRYDFHSKTNGTYKTGELEKVVQRTMP